MPTKLLGWLKFLLPLAFCVLGCRIEEEILRDDRDFPRSDISSVVLRSGLEYVFNTSVQPGEVVTPWSVEGKTPDGLELRIPDTLVLEVRTWAPITLERSEIGTRPISEIVIKRDSTVKRFDEDGGKLDAAHGRVIGGWITGGAVAFRVNDILEFRTGNAGIAQLDSIPSGKEIPVKEILLKSGRLVHFDSLGCQFQKGKTVVRGLLENGAAMDVPLDSVWYVRALR